MEAMMATEKSEDRAEVVISINDLTNPEPLLPRAAETTSYSYEYFVPSPTELSSHPRAKTQGVEEVASASKTEARTLKPEGPAAKCSLIQFTEMIKVPVEDGTGSLFERIRENCCRTFNAQSSDLELYEIKPLLPTSSLDEDVHIGVRIRSAEPSTKACVETGAEMEVQSRFERDSESLSIVEERRSAGDRTPQENVATGTKRKSMTKEESEAIGLRAQTELQSDIIREQVDLIAQRTVEARQWEERAKVLESSNDKFKKEYSNLKMLLKKSESMWHQGQSALDKLKKEFQNLAVDISEQEGLLFQKYASPDRRLAYINADTRRQLGSKSLSTLIKLLESPRTMEAVENLTSETSSRSWHEAYYLER